MKQEGSTVWRDTIESKDKNYTKLQEGDGTTRPVMRAWRKLVMRVKNFPNVFSYSKLYVNTLQRHRPCWIVSVWYSIRSVFSYSMHDSSIGLGHQPFTLVRRVRFPYRVPSCRGTPSLNGGQHWAYEVGDCNRQKIATLTLTIKCLTMNKRPIRGLSTHK